MKITRCLAMILCLAMLATGMVACGSGEGGEETTATNDNANVGICDMDEVRSEIDSMRMDAFEETAEVTDYVKFTVKDFGEFVIRLRPDVAPITVKNFQQLVSEGFYDELTFHRIMKGFMIQGGDPNGDGTGGSEQVIKGEFAANGVRNQLSHITGVISMARRSLPLDSATSQFFICNHDNAARSLDGKYAGFGYVVSGLEIVLMISDVTVEPSAIGEMSKPAETVTIEKVCFVKVK